MVKNVNKAGNIADKSGWLPNYLSKMLVKPEILPIILAYLSKKCYKAGNIAYFSVLFALFVKKFNKSGIIADFIWAFTICFFKNKYVKAGMIADIF